MTQNISVSIPWYSFRYLWVQVCCLCCTGTKMNLLSWVSGSKLHLIAWSSGPHSHWLFHKSWRPSGTISMHSWWVGFNVVHTIGSYLTQLIKSELRVSCQVWFASACHPFVFRWSNYCNAQPMRLPLLEIIIISMYLARCVIEVIQEWFVAN